MPSLPACLVVCGPPCTGKTTLARLASHLLPARWLAMDEVRARLFPRSSHRRGDVDAAYAALHDQVGASLRTGRSVLVDASYGRQAQRRALEDVARSLGMPLYVVQCRVAPAVAVERFRMRAPGHAAIDLDAERVRTLASAYPYCDAAPILDTRGHRLRSLGDLLSALGAGDGLPDEVWSSAALHSTTWPGPRDD